jgi:hypothetical protein
LNFDEHDARCATADLSGWSASYQSGVTDAVESLNA